MNFELIYKARASGLNFQSHDNIRTRHRIVADRKADEDIAALTAWLKRNLPAGSVFECSYTMCNADGINSCVWVGTHPNKRCCFCGSDSRCL